MIDHLDAEVERLVVELEVLLHLHQPVDEHGAHAAVHLVLHRHVVAQLELFLLIIDARAFISSFGGYNNPNTWRST